MGKMLTSRLDLGAAWVGRKRNGNSDPWCAAEPLPASGAASLHPLRSPKPKIRGGDPAWRRPQRGAGGGHTTALPGRTSATAGWSGNRAARAPAGYFIKTPSVGWQVGIWGFFPTGETTGAVPG